MEKGSKIFSYKTEYVKMSLLLGYLLFINKSLARMIKAIYPGADIRGNKVNVRNQLILTKRDSSPINTFICLQK